MLSYIKNKLFIKYFVSYFLLGVVLIGVVCLFIYVNVSNNVEKQLSDEKLKRLEYLSSQIDKTIIEPCESLLLKYIVESRQFGDSELSYLQSKNYVDELYTVWNLNKRLKNDIVTLPCIESINIYFPQNDYLVSSDSFIKDVKSSSYSSIIRYLDSYYSKNTMNKWVVVPVSMEGGNGEKLITCVRLLPFSFENKDKISYIYVNIYENLLTKMIKDLNLESSESLIIVNGDNRIVTSNNFNETDLPKLLDTLKMEKAGQSILRSSFGDGRTVIISQHSTINDWDIILVSSINAFYSMSYQIKSSILLFCGIALCLGFILSIYISRKFYLPVGRIIHNIAPGSLSGSLDDFIYINNMIIMLKKDVALLTKDLRDNIYYNLLHGREIRDPSLVEGNLFKYGNFLVVLVKPENGIAGKENSLCKVLNEHFSRIAELVILPLEKDSYAMIINTDKAYKDIGGLLESSINDFIELVCSKFIFGVGEMVTGMDMINFSYEDARKAIKYRFLNYNTRVFFWNDIKNREVSFNLINVDEYMNAVRGCNAKYIDEIFEQLKQKIESKKYSYASVEYTFFQLIYSLNKVAHTMDIQSNIITYKNFYASFMESKTSLEAVNWLRGITDNVVDFISDHNNTYKSNNIMQKINNYIKTNYYKELDLNNLSQIFYLNPCYISSQFKKSFNIGINDYITEVRLENAKRMLEEGNKHIEAIAKQVGYTNTTYFIKKFKERYGFTPKNYRFSEISF